MPKLSFALPKYRRHSSRDVAFVQIQGKRVYLPGSYKSKESREEYARICLEWEAQGRPEVPVPTANAITVVEVIEQFLLFAKRHYVKNGRPTGELDNVKAALRPLKELYASTPAAEFGPRSLKAVRDKMITARIGRNNINTRIGKIKRMFRWAASEELIEARVYQNLATLAGLQAGRTAAKESPPVLPVEDATVEATLPHLSPTVAAMVQLQRLTGMRPGEVCMMRPCDVDRTGPVWSYVPMEHKTEHKGRGRIIFIGPRGQEILLPFLLRPAESFCFVPKESEARRRAIASELRKTPPSCGNKPGSNRQPLPKRTPGNRYRRQSYYQAIRRACEVAFAMPVELRVVNTKLAPEERKRLHALAAKWRAKHCWSPNRMRHTAATAIRAEFGIEAAQNTLGHADSQVTLRYAERSAKIASEVALKLG